jgi:hypothetical protein
MRSVSSYTGLTFTDLRTDVKFMYPGLWDAGSEFDSRKG